MVSCPRTLHRLGLGLPALRRPVHALGQWGAASTFSALRQNRAELREYGRTEVFPSVHLFAVRRCASIVYVHCTLGLRSSELVLDEVRVMLCRFRGSARRTDTCLR